MVILVTGAMGFIGSHVVDALTVLGHECVATSHRTALDLGDAVSIEHVSVADRDAMVGIGERHAIDGIVHLADPALARLDDPEDCGDASREPSFHSSRGQSAHGAPADLDITRLQAATGFAPEYDLDQAIADYVTFLTRD
jgi:nucleoside-diphosphate-sugar epimerase